MSDASAVRRVPAWAKGVLGLVTLLALAAVVLEQGVWTRRQDLAGPFEREGSPGSRAVFFHVDDRVPLACCLEVRSDNPDHPYQSDLRLSINGEPMGPPHTPHVVIRRGDTVGFSHWSGYVFFAPPAGEQELRAFVEYSVQPTRPALWLLVLAGMSLWLLLYRQAALAFAAGRGRSMATVATSAPYWIAHGLGWIALGGLTAFLGSAAYAWFTGWALPTTAVMRWSATARWLASHEPWLGQVLVAFAAIGALATWIALLIPGGQRAIDREEARLLRFGRLAGWPIAAGCLVFSLSAMWSGMVRPGDLEASSIGGLISFSDASGYVADAYDQARDGIWHTFTLRRPFAGALRSLLLLAAGYSVPWMLVIQILILAAALCAASMAIARWRGAWAALAFFGLSYTYLRSFAPTTLTEPIGIAWGLLAVTFLVRSLATGSRTAAVAGIGALVCSLMTRMGAMFAVPALIAWLVLRRGEPRRVRTAVVVTVVVIAIFSMSQVLSRLYGGGKGVTGGNFAYTACGLAIGTTWDGCPQVLEREGRALPPPDDELNRNRILYQMARERFEAHPAVLFHRLAEGARSFAAELPDVTWRGYESQVPEPSWLPTAGLSWLCLTGIAAVLVRRREPHEVAFWIWMIAAILISAPFVYFDDGQRVLAASYIFLYMFFAMGFSRPTHVPAPATTMSTPLLSLTAAAAAALLLLTPAVSHVIYGRIGPHVDVPARDPEDYWIWGRHVSGFLVVADDAPIAGGVPTLHFSEFQTIVNASRIETYQGLIHPEAPARPFAFVYAPRLTFHSEFAFIAPPEVLERHDVAVWHLHVASWERTTEYGPYWFRVTDATAVR